MNIKTCSLLGVLALTSSQTLADANRDFSALLAKHWQNAQQEKVFFRTDPDAWKPEGKLAQWSPQAMARRDAYNNDILKALKTIPKGELDADNQMSYRLFLYERETEKASYTYQDKYFPINFLSGWHTYFAEAPANMAFLNAADYDNFLISLTDYPRFNQENIDLLKAGALTGFVHYCESFKDYGDSIKLHIVDRPQDSALFEPFTRMPANFSEQQKQAYIAQAKKVINDAVVPAYQQFYDYFQDEYMPQCRPQAGIGSVKGGDEYYAYTANYYTTTTLSPKEIHELGVNEVGRIQQEMDAIIQQVKFAGSYAQFLQFLATDPQFYASDRQDVLEKTAFITQKMYGKLPAFFGHLPRNTFTIKGSASRGAFYMPPPDNRSPGTYFLSADPKQQPLYNLEALSLHEAVPGHHLQNAIAQELNVPEFRRTLNHSAFSEGWGLYSERLGKEAGFYQNPYSDFGRLGYEMWRAVRLVVDTGIHAFGWTRQQAVDYLAARTALTEKSVNDQIDRYISWPGQALAYKIGEIKIRQLRAKAEKALGNQFDLRAFHDTVIGQGSLPMDVLDDVIDEWITKELKQAK
ncbi:MAG: DUF885 domain-containing protein [Paraglaciecola sp.]|uniref:DUF885 domain-containing protein n=1 Tax=Paraglaciecola sp. TaxID=1920173 RepID=UPI00273D5EF0|nr:DUF885 domain-containing protein [Paraglaciecola sp.]MDP5031357.1 DUF885 domain-containing protein [Paraglaciecola sp.]MDP5131685.1 DUF885 domain-containing protein [Paraglaciecola sp.]